MSEDENLINKYLSGDKKSLEKLLENNLQSIFSSCYRVCLDENDANDICQNVVIKIIKNITKFKQKSKFKTWYFRIAYNESVSFLKKKKDYVNIESIEYGLKSREDIAENTIKKEQENQITKEINKLPLIERNIILYFYFDEMSIKNISEIMQINENTIKTKLSRTKKLLKNKLIKNEKNYTREL